MGRKIYTGHKHKMSLVELIIPVSIKKVIFLIFEKLIFLKNYFPRYKKTENVFLHTKHTFCENILFLFDKQGRLESLDTTVKCIWLCDWVHSLKIFFIFFYI